MRTGANTICFNTNYSTKFKSCYASKFQEALNLLENMHISFLDECKGLVIFKNGRTFVYHMKSRI